MDGLSLITQSDFSGGMFRGPDTQRIPANGSYDIVNGLVDVDEGVIYRRGGAANKANTDLPGAITKIWDGYLLGGHRTYLEGGNTYVLDTDGVSPLQVQAGAINAIRRAVSVGGLLALPAGTSRTVQLYGGHRPIANYTTGTATFTNGSATVTGVGTSWLANARVGQPIYTATTNAVGFVKSVDSNTQITLQSAWNSPTVAGSAYTLGQVSGYTFTALDTTNNKYLATVANRLIVGGGTKILFGGRYPAENVLTFDATDYHELPAGAIVNGLQAVRDVLLVFTSAGMYSISGLALDLTDAAGNVQQRIDATSPNLLLWHDNGLSMWQGVAIVPTVDDVVLVDGISTPHSIGGPIRKLYRSYVAAGYSLGVAAVFNNHYFLPILSAEFYDAVWVDTLVCNLTTGAWTRLSGQGGKARSYAARGELPSYSDAFGNYPLQPASLLAGSGARLLDLTGIFMPTTANKNDPDGSTHTFSVTTRDFTVSSLRALVRKIRLWTEGTAAAGDAPTITAGWADGPPGAAVTALSGTGGPSDGETPAGVWAVNAARKHLRFVFSSSSPWASLKIKAVDVFVRPRGRQ